MNELTYLKIRNLIAAREANTAHANMELSRDGWLFDHAAYDREYAKQIEELIRSLDRPTAPAPGGAK